MPWNIPVFDSTGKIKDARTTISGGDEDFVLRATASANVMYATNFDDVYLDGTLDVGRSGIATLQDLIDEAIDVRGSTNGQLGLESTIKLSGANSCRITRHSTSGNTAGKWSTHTDGNRTGGVSNGPNVPRFYCQFSIYLSREEGWKASHNDAVNPVKMIKFGWQFENGEFLLINGRVGGFIGGTYNGSDGASRVLSAADNGPFTGDPTRIVNNAFYPTGTLTQFSTINDALAAVGPVVDRSSGERWLGGAGGDYDYQAGNEYLDARSDIIANGGYPNSVARGIAPGWEIEGWATVEVYLEAKAGTADRIQVWAAKYGEAPVLIIDSDFSNETSNKGNPDDHWKTIELLNFYTSYSPGEGTNASRPDTHRYYDEFITSTDPIKFPNPGNVGYAIPGHLGGLNAFELEIFAATVSSGQALYYPGYDETDVSWLNGTSGSQNLAWQTIFHHYIDEGVLHIMGKAAAGQSSGKYRHAIFDLATETFTKDVSNLTSGNLGHIYGNSAMDPVTGDLYLQPWNEQLFKYTFATDTWASIGSHVWSRGSPPVAGLTYHPDPLGTGDRGIVMHTGSGLLYVFTISTGIWLRIETVHYQTGTGAKESIGYFNSVEQASYLGGGNSSDDPKIVRIGPTGTMTVRNNPDTDAIPTKAAGTGSTSGSVVEDPDGSGNLVIVENIVSPNDRYYRSTDSALNWTQDGTHPLNTDGGGPICSFPDWGVICKILTTGLLVWRP